MALPTTCSYANPKDCMRVQDIFTIAAVGDAEVLAAPGATKYLRVQKVVLGISVTVDAAIIALEDGVGGSRLWQIKANAGDDAGTSGTTHVVDFGEQGVMLTANTKLNLTVEGQNATVHGTAVGYVTGIQ